MMVRKILLLLILLFLSPISWAQNGVKIDRSLELHVGEELPDIPKLNVLNYPENQISLDRFSDKIIILDFFDTYCSNCIAAMPKLQRLQEQYGDKIQVILVTWQDQETIEKFFRTNEFLKENQVNLTAVYADTVLRKYFPHKGVPHTAWLYKGRVQVITFSDFVKVENINLLLSNGAIKLPIKSDFSDGLSRSPFSVDEIGSVSLSGYRDAIESNGVVIQYDSILHKQKSSFYNIDVLGAYTSALSKIKKPEFLLKDERIVWNVRDSSLYKYPKEAETFDEWLLENGICYERYDQVLRPDSVQAQVILNDLNTFLGLHVYWAIREIPCLVLQRTKSAPDDLKVTESGLGGTSVLAFMIDYQDRFPPVYDEVNGKQKLDIKDYSTIEQINLQLKAYGLELKAGRRLMDVLVFEQQE